MKLSTEKRLELLLDKGSFEPVCKEIPSHFIAGRGKIEGRPVVILAVDNRSEVATKPFDVVLIQNKTIQEALSLRCPLMLLLDVKEDTEDHNDKPPILPDSGRIMAGPYGMGHVYDLMGKLSGKVPRVCLSFGQMAGTMSFFAGLSDAVAMRDCAGACIGRPDAVRKMIGEEVGFDKLGGAEIHATKTGLTDTVFETDEEVIAWGKRFLSYLPSNAEQAAPVLHALAAKAPPVNDEEIIPDNPDQAFDMRLVIDRIIDSGSLTEMKEFYAGEVITGFARVDGKTIGLVANQSNRRGGILFPETCRKIEHFVRLCGNFRIPMCFLVDTPGFMVGTAAEHGGLIQAATQLYSTLANSDTPRMVIIVRRAHSAGLYAMAGSGFDPASFIALPTATMSIYGARAIARFVTSDNLSETEREYAREMYNYATNPETFVKEYMLDEIVTVSDLRSRIISFYPKN